MSPEIDGQRVLTGLFLIYDVETSRSENSRHLGENLGNLGLDVAILGTALILQAHCLFRQLLFLF